MSGSVPPIQIISTLAGCGLLFYFYVKRKKSGIGQPFDKNNGLDPNFGGGKPIEPQGPVDTNDFKKPTCQMWNVTQNLYENAGHADWDADEQTCFTNTKNLPGGTLARYVDKYGNLTFYYSQLGQQDPPSEAGTCYFFDGQTLSTFPDFNGTTPVNRAARLCFDSSANQGDAGQYFVRTSDGVRTWNPNVYAEPRLAEIAEATQTPMWGHKEGDKFYQPSNPDQQVDQCQELVDFQPVDGSAGSMSVWGLTSRISAVPATVKDCVTAPNQRLWQASKQRIIYQNPNNGQLVETPMLGIY